MLPLCLSALVLSCLLPFPWSLPAAALSAAGLAFALLRLPPCPFRHPDWRVEPLADEEDEPDTLCLEPRLFLGGHEATADVALPFDPLPPARFRSQSGALLFSAAVALTEEELLLSLEAGEESLPWLRAWETELGIRPENLRERFPRLDTAQLKRWRGAVTRDGTSLRAYFVGDRALADACADLLDGRERPMTDGDRTRLAALPGDAICYATAKVADGRLEKLCFLGAVCPRETLRARQDALEAAESCGFRVVLDPRDKETLALLRRLSLPLREKQRGEHVLRLFPTGPDRPMNFGEAAGGYLRHRRGLAALDRRTLCLFGLCLAAGPATGFTARSAVPAAVAFAMAAASVSMSRTERQALPRHSWSLPAVCVPAAMLAAVCLVILPLFPAETARAAAWAAAPAMALPLALLPCTRVEDAAPRKRGEGAVLGIFALALLLGALALPFRPLGLLLGLLLGLAAGLAIARLL